MNGVSHYLVGLIITLNVIGYYQRKGDFKFTARMATVIFILSTISHILVDALAHFTYHPSQSNWSDLVYAGWHISTYIAEAFFAIYFLRTDIRYSFGMIGAVGFDLWDWSLRRGLGLDFLPGVHWMADFTENILFGWAPSLRNSQWALIFEVIFAIVLFLVWQKKHRTSPLSENPRPATKSELTVLILTIGSLRLLTLI